MFTKITINFKKIGKLIQTEDVFTHLQCIFMLYGLKLLPTLGQQQGYVNLFQNLASVTAYFQICDRTFQYTSGNNFN